MTTLDMITTKPDFTRPDKDTYYLNIALAVSERSTCLRRHYGCVIVKDDMIIATGYNGSPRGEENCCDRGTCYREGMEHNKGDYSECCSVHAEQNAMLTAARKDMIGATLYLNGEERHDCKVFDLDLWELIEDAKPCPICMRMIKNAGIKRIVNRSGEICL